MNKDAVLCSLLEGASADEIIGRELEESWKMAAGAGAAGMALGALGHALYRKLKDRRKLSSKPELPHRSTTSSPRPAAPDPLVPPMPPSAASKHAEERAAYLRKQLIGAVVAYTELVDKARAAEASKKLPRQVRRKGTSEFVAPYADVGLRAYGLAARNEAITKVQRQYPKIKPEWLLWTFSNLQPIEYAREAEALAKILRIKLVMPPFLEGLV